MSDALKDIYTPEFIYDFTEKVHSVYKDFNTDDFAATVMGQSWEELSLRARMLRIAEVLGKYLPVSYEHALKVLYSLEDCCTGFPYLFFPDFVAIYGQEKAFWELSMEALMRFTKLSSSEFAIRPFLMKNPDYFMEYMLRWSKDSNEHVRRLSSEGCRPRLPWGISLPMFKKDPVPVLKVLENLKADSSLYVRKSVANNLNDIAKDNGETVLKTAKEWIGKSPETDWILRQGCRTLIKKANPEALALFGYTSASDEDCIFKNAKIKVEPDTLSIGESCEIYFEMDMDWDTKAHIRLEYGIDFIKANGKPSRKLFLLSDKTVPGKTHLSGKHLHSFANLTTRRHYPGAHDISLLVNGKEAAKTSLVLKEEK